MHDLKQPQRATVAGHGIEMPDLTWHEGSNCKDIPNEVMMPPITAHRPSKEVTEFAKTICEDCPAFNECETTFLKYGGYGIWAGKFRGVLSLEAPKRRFVATTARR